MFNFNGANLRIVRDDKGNPWFIAADVCRCLELRSHHGSFSEHLTKLLPDEITSVSATGVTLRGTGMHNARLISESGLYKLVLRSDKPSAVAFQNWVTREVLPAIRKDG